MATDVDADASMSALRAKYDATTKLLAAQCDTVDRLRAEVRALRRAPEGKEPFGEYARGCSPSVAGDVASDYESKYRRAKKFVKTQVRGGADARTTTRATVRPLATTSSPPPRGTSGASPESPRDAPHPATHAPSSSLPPPPPPGDRDRQAPRTRETRGDVRGGCERARPRRGRIHRRGSRIRHDHPRRLRRRARRRASRRIRRRLRPRRRVRRRRRRTRRTRARARVRNIRRDARPRRRIVGVERDDARPRVGRRARRSRVARENRRGVPRHPSPRNAREGRARRRTRRRARRRELSRVLRGIRRRRVARRARRRQKTRRDRRRRSRRRARRRA